MLFVKDGDDDDEDDDDDDDDCGALLGWWCGEPDSFWVKRGNWLLLHDDDVQLILKRWAYWNKVLISLWIS